MSKAKLTAWGAGLLAVAVAVLSIVGFGGGEPTPAATGATGPADTAKITKQTLSDTKTVAGELAYGEETPLVSKATGTITWLPAVGATIQRGGVLLRADDKPVTLLYGPLPAYRDLALDTEGPDVKQFEQNLKALGYTGFTVDEKYSAPTVSAVKKWQKKLGMPESGTVKPAEVIYATGPVRIEEQKVRVGASATGEVLTYTSMQKVVTLNIDANDHAWAVPGASVTVTLPGGISVVGKIDKVGNEASSADDGDNSQGSNPGTGRATVPVTVTIADQQKLGNLVQTPVDVRYVSEERKDVLTVPVAALLALAEGGYGLELVTSGGTQTVAVEVGLFANGQVEVRGPSIAEGQTVGMPS
jgi:peptidoglycan hydrolase-like protein with peptidoglycan-binding domain